jgi:hypothetical protein
LACVQSQVLCTGTAKPFNCITDERL